MLLEDNTPLIKSIGKSYSLAKLLMMNMDFICHEMSVSKNPYHGQMSDKFNKLKSASKNAFEKFEKILLEEGGFDALEVDIEKIMDQIWEDVA